MAGTRTLTVLIADVVSSTELFTDLGADRADDARRALFAEFDSAVAAADGVLIKTMGDGCLASFGAAADAVTAAVSLQQRVAHLRERRVPGLALRVGVAVGDVTEEDGDVFGPAVVTASRLCSAAGESQVLATEMVRILAGDRGGHRYEAAGDLILKGLPHPVAACRVVIDFVENRPPLPAALAAVPNEVVVGREDETDTLIAAYKASLVGERRAVLVAGEPGIGKTRLIASVARRAHGDGALVLFGRCEEDLAVPYQPFAEALQGAITAIDPALVRDHIAAQGGELSRLVTGLDTPGPARADPAIEQVRLFDAVIDLLQRAATERPVVLVIDDLQWAAPGTVALLRHVLSGPADYALCILGTYRDTEADRSHALGGLLSDIHRTEGIERISLRGLSPERIEELFVAVSGDDLADEGHALATAVAARTAGNPFFVTQVLRHLVERGALTQHDGRWTVRGQLDDIDLPAGVLDVVGRRLARLSKVANDALTVAAVCGLNFGLRVLAEVRDAGGPDAVVDGLDEAVRARLLVETGPGRLAFTHAIVRGALLRELSAVKAARIHRAVGEAILNVYGDASSLPLADLAHHFTEAAILGDTASAARWATAAAAASSAQADYRGGIAVLERALAVIEAIEPVNQEARFDVAIGICEGHLALAEAVPDGVDSAIEAARQLRSGARMLRVASARNPFGSGITDPLRESLYRETIELLPDDAAPLRFLALALTTAKRSMEGEGSFVNDLDELFAELPAMDVAAPRIAALARSWLVYATLGLPGAARRLQLSHESAAVPDDTVDPWYDELGSNADVTRLLDAYRSHALIGLGRRSDYEAVVAELRAHSERTGNMSELGMAESQLAMLAMLDGRWTEALERADRMLAAAPGDGNFLMSYLAITVITSVETGRASEVAPMVESGLAVSPELAAVHAAAVRGRVELGEVDLAIDGVRAIIERWESFARDWSWPMVLAQAAEAIARVGLRDTSAGIVLDELDAYSGELVIVGAAVLCLGAYDRYRGMLLDLLGRHDEAVVALEDGLALEESIHAATLAVRTRYWLALALSHRGGAGDKDRAAREVADATADAERLGMPTLAAACRELGSQL